MTSRSVSRAYEGEGSNGRNCPAGGEVGEACWARGRGWWPLPEVAGRPFPPLKLCGSGTPGFSQSWWLLYPTCSLCPERKERDYTYTRSRLSLPQMGTTGKREGCVWPLGKKGHGGSRSAPQQSPAEGSLGSHRHCSGVSWGGYLSSQALKLPRSLLPTALSNSQVPAHAQVPVRDNSPSPLTVC